MARSLLRFLLSSLLLLLCVFVLIAVIGHFSSDLTVAFIVRALDWSGFACMAIGCFSVLGAFASRGSFEVQFSRSAGTENMDRRAARDLKDMLGSLYYLIFFCWTGGLQLLLSLVIHHTMT